MSALLGELVPCGGGDPIPLVKPLILVGRGATCDVLLASPTVSARHCELEFIDGSWFVRDLDSHNGIRVDGVRCDARQLLPDSVLSVAQQRYTVVYTRKSGGSLSDSVDSWVDRSLAEDLASKQRRAAERNSAPAASVAPPRRAAEGDGRTGQRGGIWPVPTSLGELLPCGGGESIPLLKRSLVVGRHPTCDIVLEFPSVSSRHCLLEFKQGYWFVRDLASRNGIRVDGVPCESKWLMPSDVLSLAKHRYQIAYVPQAAEPPPEADEHPFGRSLLEKAGLVLHKDSDESRGRPQGNRDVDTPRERWRIDE